MDNCRCNGHGKHQEGSVCLECEIPQTERIRYFTGRMMAARDFTDEQRYFMGKERRHNQWLHGSGVACGLKVKQHDNYECRDHFVIVEPGLAIDCCGRELLLNGETVLDFRQAYLDWLHEQQGPDCLPDKDKHVLQIAARYSESPTEDVPLLFEACANGDQSCTPSRVREIVEMGVVVDPEPVIQDIHAVSLKWKHTLTVEHPTRIAIDEKQSKVYVLAGRDPSKLYVFRMENDSLIDARVLAGKGVDLALSADGNRAYVALDSSDGMFVDVLDTTCLGEHRALVAHISLAAPSGSHVRVAVSPTDGALFILNGRARQVLMYDSSVNIHGADHHEALRGSAPVDYRPMNLTVTPDGHRVIVANRDGHDLTVINPHRLHHTETVVIPDAAPYGVVAAFSEGRMRLFVSDRDGQALWMLVSTHSEEDPFVIEGGPVSLKPYRPVDMIVSPDGRWLYLLLEGQEDRGRVQVADIYAWTHHAPGEPAGEPLEVFEVEEEEEEEEEEERRRKRLLDEREEEEEEEEEEEHEHHRSGHHERYEEEEHEHHHERYEEEEHEHHHEGYESEHHHWLHHERHEPHEHEGEEHGEQHYHIEQRQPLSDSTKNYPMQAAGKPAAQEQPAPLQQAQTGGTLVKQPEKEEWPVLGLPVPVGRRPRDLALAGREGRLYISYEGSHEIEETGSGVAIIDIMEESCLDLFQQSLDGCVACKTGGEWVILATISDYIFDQVVDDKRIDNFTGRRWLASTGTLTEAVTCLLTNGNGGRGEPGPAGPQGLPGEKGEPGEPGEGLNRHLTHICAISWEHAGEYEASLLAKNGLLVAFDRPVRMGDIHRHSFIVTSEQPQGDHLSCWCEVRPDSVRGVPLYLERESCEIEGIDPRRCEDPDDLVNGALFKFSGVPPVGEYRVTIKGNFIRDEHGHPVDADHLAPWLPERRSGDWVAGGTFESWFRVIETSKPKPGKTYTKKTETAGR